MNFKSILVVLVLGACLTQEITAHTKYHHTQVHYDIEKGLIDDLIAKAKEAIDNLKNKISETITSALETINNLKDQVLALAQAAIAAAEEQLKAVVGNALELIEEIRQKAEEAGVNIADCIAASEDRFAQMLATLIENEKNCVFREVETALSLVQNATNIVTNALDQVVALPGKLQDCISGTSPLRCLSGLIVEIGQLAVNLPLQVAKQVKDVTQYVGGLKVRLEVCAAAQIAAAGIEAAKIVGEVAKCAAEKRLLPRYY